MDEHVFIEDIIYCPSQIYYYFTKPDGEHLCLYIRQRRGSLTVELVKLEEDYDFSVNLEEWKRVNMSREYDINNKSNQEEEEKEIVALEKEVMDYLRQKFPEIIFPDNPPRKSRFLRDII